MPVIAPQHRKSAEVERATETSIGALDAPNTPLVMTYKEKTDTALVSPECLAWIDARCEETGSSALEILIACAEMCADLE
jgi:hypothetical protein